MEEDDDLLGIVQWGSSNMHCQRGGSNGEVRYENRDYFNFPLNRVTSNNKIAHLPAFYNKPKTDVNALLRLPVRQRRSVSACVVRKERI